MGRRQKMLAYHAAQQAWAEAHPDLAPACEWCGKPVVNNTKMSNNRYCSLECRKAADQARRRERKSKTHRDLPVERECHRNPEVDCLKTTCDSCGFNPLVAAVRIKKVRDKENG